jgi:Fe-S-cluster containining protein
MSSLWAIPRTVSRPGYDTTIEAVSLPEKVQRIVASYQTGINNHLFKISCLTGLTGWQAKGALPRQFIKLFEKAIDLYDELVQFLLGHLHREGFAIQCSPGCIHCCCHMPIGVTVPELIYLYRGMHQSGLFPKFFRRCLEAEEEWREILKSHAGTQLRGTQPAFIRETVLKQYHQLEHRCPFLQDDMCQVYPCRPLACRMHFSLSSPYWCRPSHFQNNYAVRFNIEPEERIFETLEHIGDLLQLHLSDIMVCGLLELSVNVMKFQELGWSN